jgi:hypothetical protein
MGVNANSSPHCWRKIFRDPPCNHRAHARGHEMVEGNGFLDLAVYNKHSPE